MSRTNTSYYRLIYDVPLSYQLEPLQQFATDPLCRVLMINMTSGHSAFDRR